MADTPFQTRDAGTGDFWEERWERAHTPWNRGGVQQAFEAFVTAKAPCSTLIPGCGHAHEAKYLAERGWAVTAIDIAPSAVREAQRLLGENAHCVRHADYFAYANQTHDWIFERTFLCALPLTVRPRFAKKLAALLRPGALYAGLFFVDAEAGALPGPRKGPPFASTPAELDALLCEHFSCTVDEPVTDSLPMFAGKELWQVWVRNGVEVTP